MSGTNWMRASSFIGRVLQNLDLFAHMKENYWAAFMRLICVFFSCVIGTGLGFSNGGLRGKMVFLAQIVPFHRNGTGLTSFRSRIRLGAFSTFLPCIFKEQLVGLGVSSLTPALTFLFLLIRRMGTLSFLLEIGTRVIIRLVLGWVYGESCFC